ncbi:DUF1853 family protein [Pararobbsia alpina]|uniref:DUF1853 domain-containing protein n=1 Tax=Pararobbsia alpina TaxID=621374 RepID=A0A6S7CPM7_9BURK|nr:DUF1853 family protein [Pararobbsia alpina]CAB3794832.1 hypothetical protein LMG28138_03757 [Pararobbsia alpina]
MNRAAAFAAAMATLRDAAVRDLAWLLLAPRLLSESSFGSLLANGPVEDDLLDWLYTLDADPAPLRLSLAGLRTQRVGHYAERLVHFVLSHSPHFRLIAANLPLRLQKQTVGECDFLLENLEGHRLHWELAVKCYLYVEPTHASAKHDDPLASFVGPALGDRLDIKLRRMLEHQLPLSGRVDYTALLPPGPWRAQMWVSGWLFDRFDQWHAGRALNIDPRLAPDLLSGFWVPRRAWSDVSAALGADGWTRLPRLRWIAPLAEPDQSFCDVETMSRRIETAFAQSPVVDAERQKARDDPFAIAAWKKEADGRWHEIARGFIVADDWEERAIAFAAYHHR